MIFIVWKVFLWMTTLLFLNMDFKDNQNIDVSHFLSSIRPKTLMERLESYLIFSHHELKNNLQMFLENTVKLSEEFQLVDDDLRKKLAGKKRNWSGNKT